MNEGESFWVTLCPPCDLLYSVNNPIFFKNKNRTKVQIKMLVVVLKNWKKNILDSLDFISVKDYYFHSTVQKQDISLFSPREYIHSCFKSSHVDPQSNILFPLCWSVEYLSHHSLVLSKKHGSATSCSTHPCHFFKRFGVKLPVFMFGSTLLAKWQVRNKNVNTVRLERKVANIPLINIKRESFPVEERRHSWLKELRMDWRDSCPSNPYKPLLF